jgi:hypothetical protein
MAEIIVTCTVIQAGAGGDGSEGPNPVIYILLNDVAGSFVGGAKNFVAADLAKREILAVALAAITGQKRVQAVLDPPNPANNPYTFLYRLFLLA